MSFPLEQAVELLERAHAGGRLAHAYLVTGPRGSGKEALAMRLIEMEDPSARARGASSLGELASGTVSVVEPESKSRRIGIDAIREVEQKLHMAAAAGATKFAVFRDADRMGVAAANAFLKTLEEPPDSCRLLLLSANPEALLDTVLSRCIRVALSGRPGPPELDEGARGVLEALRDHTLEGAGGAGGALALAARFAGLLKDEKAAVAAANEAAQKAEAARYRNTTEGDFLKRREEYFKAATEAEYLGRRNRLVEVLAMWFGDAMRQRCGYPRLDLPDYAKATGILAQRFGLENLSARMDAVEGLRADLGTNVFEALALEAAFVRAFA